MSELRFNFLNWRPDLEDENHDGLTVADNVIHQPEGYVPIGLLTTTSFATTGGLGASVYTVLSCQAKQVGPGTDVLCAWIANNTLHVGLNGVTATTSTTGYPLTYATLGSAAITSFNVCEAYDKVFFAVQGTGVTDPGGVTTTRTMMGYLDY